jgi:hypothetical protein
MLRCNIISASGVPTCVCQFVSHKMLIFHDIEVLLAKMQADFLPII